MIVECSTCSRHFDPEREDRAIKIIITVFTVIMCSLVIGGYWYDSTHAVPPSDISLTAVALTSWGLETYPNATSHPVFRLVAKFTNNSGSACSKRISTTVSYSGLTLAKWVDDSDERIDCTDNNVYEKNELFAMEMSGPALNLPSSVDIHKPMFDVDIEFEGNYDTSDVKYHVSCKGLGLAKDFPVPCNTTVSNKG